jgi:hypothetical protein
LTGLWVVTLSCADYKDDAGGAQCYTFRFLADVKNGLLEAQYGRAGKPRSLRYTGRIQPDGSAEIVGTAIRAILAMLSGMTFSEET